MGNARRIVRLALGVSCLLAATACTSETVTTVVEEVPDTSADAREVSSVVASIQAGDSGAFTPEALAAVSDPSQILPAGAVLEPVEGTTVVDGDTATQDVVMHVPGQPDVRYWVFLERRNGQWLVYQTIPMAEG